MLYAYRCIRKNWTYATDENYLNEEKGYMLIRGSVPGSKNSFVRVSKAVKR